MKNFLKSAVLSLAGRPSRLCACDSTTNRYVDPGLEGDARTTSRARGSSPNGSGAPLAEGSFVYIELTRKDQLFTDVPESGQRPARAN